MKNMTYGQRLKWARNRAKLTQVQLAEISGVKQGTISKIERGDQAESAFDAILGHHLNVSPYWLSTGVGEPDGWVDLSVQAREDDYLLPLVRGLRSLSPTNQKILLDMVEAMKRNQGNA